MNTGAGNQNSLSRSRSRLTIPDQARSWTCYDFIKANGAYVLYMIHWVSVT